MSARLELNGEGVVAPAPQTPTIGWLGWRHKGLLMAGVLLGLGISAALTVFQTPIYQSTAHISILNKHLDTVTDARTTASEDIAPPTEVLKSYQIVERAIRTREAGTQGEPPKAEAEWIAHVQEGLGVVSVKIPSGQGNLFKLSYRSAQAEDCRAVLDAVLVSYKQFLEKKHQTTASDTVELLVREQRKVREELAAKETAYRAFREQAPLLGKTRDGMEPRQESLNSIQLKRSALRLRKVEVEGQLAAVELARKEGRSPDAVLVMLAEFARANEAAESGTHKPESLQEQLLPLMLEERKLLRLHGAKHPEVVAVREKIETARRMLLLPANAWQVDSAAAGEGAMAAEDPIHAHVAFLRQKLAHLKISEEMLAVVLRKEEDEGRSLANYEIQNEEFQTDISLSRQLHEALVKRLNEASMIKDAGGYQVEVIEPPSAAKRVGPNLILNLGLGASIGLVAALLLALWITGRSEHRADRSIGQAHKARLPEPVSTEAANGAVASAAVT